MPTINLIIPSEKISITIGMLVKKKPNTLLRMTKKANIKALLKGKGIKCNPTVAKTPNIISLSPKLEPIAKESINPRARIIIDDLRKILESVIFNFTLSFLLTRIPKIAPV